MNDRTRARAIALISTPILAGMAFAASASPRGVLPSDVLTYPSIAGLAVSPDGKNIVYVVEKSTSGGDGYVHQMFLLDTDGRNAPRPLSDADAFDDAPEFSPDGRYLAFLADDGRGTQLRVLRLGSKTSRAVTHFASGVGEFAWAPDSSRFVVSAFSGAAVRKARERGWRARHSRRDGNSRKSAESRDYDENAPIVVDRSVPRRDGEGWLDHQHSQLWIVSREGGTPQALTEDAFDNSEPSWSPDGAWIAFTSNREPDPDLSDNTDIYLVRPDGRDLRRFAGGPGPESEPTWSRHGDRLAWLSSALPNDYYLNTHLIVAALEGGDPIDLTTGMQAGVAEDWVQVSSSRARPMWSADDATIYAPFERRGTSYLAALSSTRAGEPARELSQGSYTLDFVRYSAGGHPSFFFARGDASHPSEVVALADQEGDAREPRRLTAVHEKWLKQRELSQPSRLTAKSTDGVAVESWLYPPLGLEPGKRYPLIVYLHGGPEAFDGEYFDEGLENQIFPGAGFGVLRVNYRGSTSYGESFSASIRGDWHRREYDDIMAALDAALQQPWVDGARLGIGGWSYGGIQTVWAVGHTDRFRAAAPERFEVDYLSAFGEDHWLAQYLAELGDPSEHADLYRRLSPITYVTSIRTPLLLIAGEDDLNCPLPQALQLYARLKARQAPVELVVYPGESHTFARPDHLRDRLERLVRWFETQLR